MKTRIISVLCLLAMLLSVLIGCSAPSDGGDINTDMAGAMTDDVKNKLTIAKELANEVDKMQTISAVLGVNSNNATRKTATVSSNDPLSFSADLTELSLSREDIVNDPGEGITSFEFADQIVKRLKNEKDQALRVCKCLNTWVKLGEGPYSAVYRLNYDATTDTVTVEYHSHPSDLNSYRRFTVTMDAEGKAVISSYSAAYTDTEIKDTTELHYYEDKYYFSLSKHIDEEGHAYENTLFLDLSNKVQAYVSVNSTTYYENGVPVRTEYVSPDIRFEYSDGYYTVTAKKDGGSLYHLPKPGQSSGSEIGSCSASGLFLDLGVLEGWSTVSRDGDRVTLNTNKGSFESIGFTYNSLGTENGVNYTFMLPYFEGYTHANLWMNFSGTEEVSTKDKIRGAFTLLEREWGLTIDADLKNRLINAGDRHGELCEQFHFKNGIYAKDIVTTEDYFALLDTMRTFEMTLDQLKTVYDGSGINQSEQTVENTYFEFLSFSMNGKAALNAETGDLSLTGISASISPSLLMSEGHTYSLVFAWASPGEIHEIGSADAVYEGKELTFTSELTVAAASRLMKYGEYRLVAFIAADKLGAHDRISKLFDLGGAAEGNILLEEGLIKTEMTATAEGITLVNTKLPPKTETAE